MVKALASGPSFVLCLVAATACARAPQPAAKPTAVHLVDLYRQESVQGRVSSPAPPRTEWRFDEAAPAEALEKAAATRGWSV